MFVHVYKTTSIAQVLFATGFAHRQFLLVYNFNNFCSPTISARQTDDNDFEYIVDIDNY